MATARVIMQEVESNCGFKIVHFTLYVGTTFFGHQQVLVNALREVGPVVGSYFKRRWNAEAFREGVLKYLQRQHEPTEYAYEFEFQIP